MLFDRKRTATAAASDSSSHFSIDHLHGDLKRRSVFSSIVRAVAQGVQFVLTLAYNVVLARLLEPDQFGLVAIVMTIVATLQIFRDMGLSTATVQRTDITHAQVSNLFWVNLATSGIISLLIAASAPVVVWFFHDARLLGITLALAALFVLNGLAAQHTALLNRQMRFVAISVIEIVAMAAAFLLGGWMAYAGFGYWSLVAATLSQAALRLVATWMTSGWRPQRPVRGVGTRSLLIFGADLTIGGFVYSIARGADTILLGRFIGTDAVGLYTRAAALLFRPMEQLINPIHTVIVPVLSRLQEQPERYRKTFLLVFEALAITGFGFTAITLPLATPLTVTLLGSGWARAAPAFAGFTAAAVFVPLSAAASWLYTSQGRSREGMVVAIISGIIVIIATLAGLPFGPTGVAVALSIAGLCGQIPLSFHIGGRSGPISTRDLWTAFLCHLPICLIAGGATYLARATVIDRPPLWQLVICAPIGIVAGAAMLYVLPPSRKVCLGVLDALMTLRRRSPSSGVQGS